MIQSLYVAESGLNSQQKMIDVISNNIANMSTPGFKKSAVGFVELLAPTDSQFIEQPITEPGRGVQVAMLQQNFAPGELKQTGDAMDIAINGEGFIAVETTDGTVAYARAGRLQLDAQGYLSTTDGLRLAAQIQLPPDFSDLTVTQSGSVLARVQGSAELIELGQIQLTRFPNPDALKATASNLYLPAEAAGIAETYQPGEHGTGRLVQGYRELSNVSMNEEMVSLMLAQRGYQLNARLVQVADQVLETINNIRR